jgi:hypothetical protein
MSARKTAQQIADAAIAATSADRFSRLRSAASEHGVDRYPVRDRSGDTYRLSRVLDIEEARRKS